MSRRLLAVCLLAYPRSHRDRDGGYLLDLALELGAGSGIRRQATSLLRSGLAERFRGRRRRGLVLAGGAAVAAALVLLGGGLAAGAGGRAEVEVYACSGACPEVAGLVADKQQDGWSCERQTLGGEVAWRCVSP